MRTLTRLFGCLTAVVALAAQAAPPELPTGTPESVGLSAERLDAIGPWMTEQVEAGNVPGMVTMVARDGKAVYLQAAGTLDLETGAPVATDSLFRIYSMTKPVTSVGLMMLYDEGRVALDDPVAKYIPELGDLKVWTAEGEVPLERPVTVADLLRHTAGFTYGFFSDTPVDKLYLQHNVLGQRDLAALVDTLAGLPLLHQPGERWHYSVATDVTGHLIERISGKPLDVYFRERIFAPLGMHDTGFVVPPGKLDRFGTNHQPNPAGGFMVVESPRPTEAMPQPGFVGEVTLFNGGGGLVSTASDYMRFALMLAGDGQLGDVRILKPETVAMMRTDQLPEGAPGVFGGPGRFGLGFAIVGAQPSRLDVGPPGSYRWFGVAGTQFWIDPAEDIVGIMMIQVRGNRQPLVQQFVEHVYAALGEAGQ